MKSLRTVLIAPLRWCHGLHADVMDWERTVLMCILGVLHTEQQCFLLEANPTPLPPPARNCRRGLISDGITVHGNHPYVAPTMDPTLPDRDSSQRTGPVPMTSDRMSCTSPLIPSDLMACEKRDARKFNEPFSGRSRRSAGMESRQVCGGKLLRRPPERRRHGIVDGPPRPHRVSRWLSRPQRMPGP
jgi:hypothetical protein